MVSTIQGKETHKKTDWSPICHSFFLWKSRLEILQNFEKVFSVVYFWTWARCRPGPAFVAQRASVQFFASKLKNNNSRNIWILRKNLVKSWCVKASSRNVKNQRGLLPRRLHIRETLRSVDHSPKFKTRKIKIGSECFNFLNFSEQTKTHTSWSLRK